MKKRYKSSKTKNHKIKKTIIFGWSSLKRLRSLKLFLDFVPEIQNALWENQVTNDA